MNTYLIDTHAHIDMIKAPLHEILTNMNTYEVKKAIIPSVEEKTLNKILNIAMALDTII